MTVPTSALRLSGVVKTFTMHLQGGIVLPVVSNVSFEVMPGKCVALHGPSGSGKSSILKMIYGSYRCDRGEILVRCDGSLIDVATAEPRAVLALRRNTIGYVSQFLRAVPRVAALEVVAESVGHSSPDAGRTSACRLLQRLNIPERLWSLPPATFSGGEQQRVNVARGFIRDLPIMLLDEPTASLDAESRAVVVELIQERKRCGAAIVIIAHDKTVRDAVADVIIDVTQFAGAA